MCRYKTQLKKKNLDSPIVWSNIDALQWGPLQLSSMLLKSQHAARPRSQWYHGLSGNPIHHVLKPRKLDSWMSAYIRSTQGRPTGRKEWSSITSPVTKQNFSNSFHTTKVVTHDNPHSGRRCRSALMCQVIMPALLHTTPHSLQWIILSHTTSDVMAPGSQVLTTCLILSTTSPSHYWHWVASSCPHHIFFATTPIAPLQCTYCCMQHAYNWDIQFCHDGVAQTLTPLPQYPSQP